jgi:hypothetical protein
MREGLSHLLNAGLPSSIPLNMSIVSCLLGYSESFGPPLSYLRIRTVAGAHIKNRIIWLPFMVPEVSTPNQWTDNEIVNVSLRLQEVSSGYCQGIVLLIG